MTSASTTVAARRTVGSRRRTKAASPAPSSPPDSPRPKKMKAISEVLAKAKYAVAESGDYGDASCEKCGSGEGGEELLLCDKCDKGYHMKCVRPIVVRVPIGPWFCPSCSGDQRRRVRKLSQRKIIDFFRIQKCDHIRKDKCCSSQGFLLSIDYQKFFNFACLAENNNNHNN